MEGQILTIVRISQANFKRLNPRNTGLPRLLCGEAQRQLKIAFELLDNAPPYLMTIEEFSKKLNIWAQSLSESCQYDFSDYKHQLLDFLLFFICNFKKQLLDKDLELIVKKCFQALKIPYVDV